MTHIVPQNYRHPNPPLGSLAEHPLFFGYDPEDVQYQVANGLHVRRHSLYRGNVVLSHLDKNRWHHTVHTFGEVPKPDLPELWRDNITGEWQISRYAFWFPEGCFLTVPFGKCPQTQKKRYLLMSFRHGTKIPVDLTVRDKKKIRSLVKCPDWRAAAETYDS